MTESPMTSVRLPRALDEAVTIAVIELPGVRTRSQFVREAIEEKLERLGRSLEQAA